jgi:dynein heavy chain
LAIENEEILRNKSEADSILVDKLPALEEARIKVSEIQKSELDYIKSFISPPKLI